MAEINFEQALASLNTGGSGAFIGTGYPQQGKTQIIVIRDSRVESDNALDSIYQNVDNYDQFNDKINTKHMILVALLDGDNIDKMPPYHVDHEGLFEETRKAMKESGAQYRVIPLALTVTALKGILQQFKEGWSFAEVDENGNVQNEPTVMNVNRSGSGLDTEYTVSVPPQKKLVDSIPTIVHMPDMTLTEIANDYSEYQRGRAGGNADTQNNNDDGKVVF